MLINKNTVYSIKHQLGNLDWKIVVGNKEFDAVEITSFIFKYIKAFTEKQLDLPLQKAVITIPSYFNKVEIFNLKHAAYQAGLEQVKLLPDSLAIAYAYGWKKNSHQKILVLDFQDNLTAISILEINGSNIKEIALRGDKYLGGDDWNDRIINWIKEQLKQQYNLDLDNSALNQRIKWAAKNAQMELSSANEVDISLPFFGINENNEPINFETKLTKSKFEKITNSLLARLKKMVYQTLQDANLQANQIDEVLLAGEGTTMNQIHYFFKNFIGHEPHGDINLQEVKAIGAAYYGHKINWNGK